MVGQTRRTSTWTQACPAASPTAQTGRRWTGKREGEQALGHHQPVQQHLPQLRQGGDGQVREKKHLDTLNLSSSISHSSDREEMDR